MKFVGADANRELSGADTCLVANACFALTNEDMNGAATSAEVIDFVNVRRDCFSVASGQFFTFGFLFNLNLCEDTSYSGMGDNLRSSFK